VGSFFFLEVWNPTRCTSEKGSVTLRCFKKGWPPVHTPRSIGLQYDVQQENDHTSSEIMFNRPIPDSDINSQKAKQIFNSLSCSRHTLLTSL
jgi:hypothetical protein